MANQNTLADLSQTASSNLNFQGQSIAGTALGSTIDQMLQKLGAMLASFIAEIGGTGTVGGSANAVTLTTSATAPFSALAAGLVVAFKAGSANTTAATINVDSLGAKAIRRQGDTALSANDILANGIYLLRYDTAYNSAAGAWVLLNPAADGLLSSYLKSDTEDQTITGGARVTVKDLGALSAAGSNTITPDPGDRPKQKITNDHAGSILPGSNNGDYLLEVINTTGAGAITTTGWTLKGDAFDTTTSSKFLCSCHVSGDQKVMIITKTA